MEKITEKQLKYLTDLVNKNNITLMKDIAELTKKEASGLIDCLISNKPYTDAVKALIYDEKDPQKNCDYILWGPDSDESLPF